MYWSLGSWLCPNFHSEIIFYFHIVINFVTRPFFGINYGNRGSRAREVWLSSVRPRLQDIRLISLMWVFFCFCNIVCLGPNKHHCLLFRARFQNLLHPLLLVTHLQLRSQQSCQYSTHNLLQMEDVFTKWNLDKNISTNSNSKIVRTAFWPCHKIYTYIKKKTKE